ncbi:MULTISPECIES: transglycosylase SLT domain-containing protein [Methylotenera]|uniref:transglycosylase SLT domain-containing protein n=1 Tax=Methylotenera TaxID=359407 RepID=UPI0003628774|nr:MULTISPECIES: transglycosylase SLT domain-containing protein [Methylotenera]
MLGTNIKTIQLITQAKLKQQKLIANLFGLFLLACSTSYSNFAIADTNVAGVEIEVITDTVDSNLVGDPVQDFLTDVEGDDSNQLGYQENPDTRNDLWARIKDGYAIPNIQSQYTTNHEAWYAARPDYIKRMLDRSQKYLFHIVEEVEKRGMPTEIALLPMIESAFNPQAYSTSSASGIWQFIPSTGKHFGLQQTWWVDNRRDVTAATSAALTYLQKLHSMFGTWDLALAAYNAGEGTVQRAIDKNRRQGLPTDYQSLSLPPETMNYVPKLQAMKNIITHPEQFGLKIGSIPNRPYFARVTTPKQIDAKLAAELAEVSFEEFSSLNPSYNRPVITSTGEKHQLLLPVWAAERFVTNLANYDKPLTNWQTYNVKRGERMDNIAKKFGINVGQLRNVNGLSSSQKMRTSQAILVPAIYNDKTDSNLINVAELEQNNHFSDENVTNIEPKHPAVHKVKKGDTLQALANKYDTTSKMLIRINQLKNSTLKVGQTILLTNARFSTNTKASTSKSTSTRKKFTVKPRVNSKSKSSRHVKAHSNIRIR